MALSSRSGGVLGAGVIAASLLFASSPLFGCGTIDRSLTGEWKGYHDLQPGMDPTLARNIAAVKLTLEPSGKFKLVDGGLPLGGKWRREGDALTFDVETLMERPLSSQPEAARKAAGAFSGRIEGDAIVFRGLTPPDVRLRREANPGD